MSLQYVEPSATPFPLVIFPKGGGTQKPGAGQGGSKPTLKKASKKKATKKK